MVNAEAMACATTVVASNRGGIPEVLGKAGVLVDPENVVEFANAISGLLSDQEACKQLGYAGYKRCQEKFDWRVISEYWIELIRGVTAPPASKRKTS